jgi:hypothetical protein
MEIKPTIFIGSSKEGLKIATALKEKLERIAEIEVWTDIFELNKSNFDNLTSQIAVFDYAILIASGDDTIVSRRQKSLSPRDNILFEFGLFVGGLGASRVFYLPEKDSKLPSDLLGITLPFIPKFNSMEFNHELDKVVSKIEDHISQKEQTFDLGFLPSTALAYGYFINFIEKTVERLLEDKVEKKEFLLENGSKFKIETLKFTVLIPDDLSDDMFKKVSAKRLKDGWHKLKVAPRHIRDYDFSIDVSKAANGELSIVDIPFTLNALNAAVELYFKKAHLGKTRKEKLLEYREIRNFKKTLDYFISKSSIAKGIVTTEIVNI